MRVTLTEAAVRLPEFANHVEAGGDVVLTRGDARPLRLVLDPCKPTSEELRMLLERLRGVAKQKPGWEDITAATAADLLYDENGLPI